MRLSSIVLAASATDVSGDTVMTFCVMIWRVCMDRSFASIRHRASRRGLQFWHSQTRLPEPDLHVRTEPSAFFEPPQTMRHRVAEYLLIVLHGLRSITADRIAATSISRKRPWP